MRTAILIILVLSTFVSCNRNRLKTDEKELKGQILTEEQQLAQEAELRAEREKQLADSIARLPKGFRFKEDRSVDSKNPPDVISFPSLPNKGKEILLSDIVDTITYFVMQPLPDTSIHASLRLKAKISGDKIIVYGLSGLYVYNLSGELDHPIIRNKVNGINIKRFPGGSYQMQYIGEEVDYYGEIGEVWPSGDEIFFTTLDKARNRHEWKKINIYDPSSCMLPDNVESDPSEFPGKKLFEFRKELPGNFQQLLNHESYTRPVGAGFYLNAPSLWTTSKLGKQPVILNENSDTICEFSMFNKIENFTHSIISRGSTPVGNYTYGHQIYLYIPLSDTIFKVVPPNRFVPVYVFNYGKYKINANEYFAPGEIKNKLYCTDIIETSKKLFIRYKNIDGDNDLGIYFKKTKEFVPILNSSKQNGITDNLIGYFDYWPENLNEKREDCRIFNGATLKYFIKNQSKENNTAKYRNEFEKFVNRLSDESIVAIIYQLKP
jgi:hypothetical protein